MTPEEKARENIAYVSFSQQGSLGRVYQLFGCESKSVIEELNEALAA